MAFCFRWYFEYLRNCEKLQIVRVKSERHTVFEAVDFEHIYAIFRKTELVRLFGKWNNRSVVIIAVSQEKFG